MNQNDNKLVKVSVTFGDGHTIEGVGCNRAMAIQNAKATWRTSFAPLPEITKIKEVNHARV